MILFLDSTSFSLFLPPFLNLFQKRDKKKDMHETIFNIDWLDTGIFYSVTLLVWSVLIMLTIMPAPYSHASSCDCVKSKFLKYAIEDKPLDFGNIKLGMHTS